jgi:enterochelin esterase-like enzyme
MKTRKWIAVLAAVVFAAPALAADAGHHERVAVQAPSLAGNLAGDPAVRQVSIYLPPGYAKNRKARYPVLYLLHGFTDSDVNWFGLEGRKHFVRVQSSVDAAFTAGVPEMIVVMPDALTKFGGSMYSTSAVNGDWETFIASELVAHVDSHYRTLARPRSRGLAGHSMGGYGTLRIAMKRPGVFSSIYAMSPCCLSPAPFDPAIVERAAKIRTVEEFAAADFLTKAVLASGAAFSPNPRKPPLFIDLPLPNDKATPEVVAAWAAAGPLTMVHQYLPALKSYGAIAIDSGDKDDFIAPSVVRMHELLEGYGIAHDYEIYDGDHLNRIERRLATKVLPFFGKHLAFK